MTVADISTKINLRLNKGDSQDYDNLWNYHKEDAFNKGVLEWVRRQKRGKNQTQEGDEESDARVDDLQVLLKTDTITVRDRKFFAESNKLPSDYLYHKRVTPIVSKGNCKGVRIASQLREEGNVDELLPSCSFKFEDSFHTLRDNRIYQYHNGDFTVDRLEITYYRLPKMYDFTKLNSVIEFKNDVCELLVDEACKILSSDIESFNQSSMAEKRAEQNN